jgi:hypothetical protein
VATAYIREYADIGATFGGKVVQAPSEPGIADQTITTSATHAESNAFNVNTHLIAVSTAAAQAHCIAFSATRGATPTATTSNLRLPANSMFFFVVYPGDKLSLIDVA